MNLTMYYRQLCSSKQILIDHVCAFVESNQVQWTDIHERPIKFKRTSILHEVLLSLECFLFKEKYSAAKNGAPPVVKIVDNRFYLLAIFDAIMNAHAAANSKKLWMCKVLLIAICDLSRVDSSNCLSCSCSQWACLSTTICYWTSMERSVCAMWVVFLWTEVITTFQQDRAHLLFITHLNSQHFLTLFRSILFVTLEMLR